MAEQSSDPWRILWRFATSNEVLVALLLAIAASVTLTVWIPQRPSSDVAYARWLSQTQARFGEANSTMRTLGLFSLMSSFGFRILLALLSGCVFLRLVEDADRLHGDQRIEEPSGKWRPIIDRQFGKLLDDLRRRRYRVVDVSSFFQVDRWPWSGVLSLVTHLGALILLISLLLSHLFGWQVEGLILQRGGRRSLPGHANWVALTEDGSEAHHSTGVVAFIEESGPGVDVSATDGDGDMLELLLSSDAEPSTELKIALTGETYFAIPEVALIVRLMPQSEEPYSRADAQIYNSPTGEVIAERVTDRGGYARFNVAGVTLAFDPAPYARLIATHNPGRPLAGLGLVMLVTGLLGSLIWPERRFWLREQEASIEAAGSFPSQFQHEEKVI
jgi:hypothetical protein